MPAPVGQEFPNGDNPDENYMMPGILSTTIGGRPHNFAGCDDNLLENVMGS